MGIKQISINRRESLILGTLLLREMENYKSANKLAAQDKVILAEMKALFNKIFDETE